MKYLFFLLAFSQSCDQYPTGNTKISSLTYSANTRGSSYQCTIDSMSIKVQSNEKSNERQITSEDWFAIVAKAKTISLTNLENFKATTDKSSTDRARIAMIKIQANDKIYESTSFDEGNPPNELKELINLMLTMAKTIE